MKEPINRFMDQIMVEKRKSMEPHFCELSNCTDPKDIDYSIPEVKILWVLSDMRWLAKMKNQKGRLAFRQEFGAELYDYYMHKTFYDCDEQRHRPFRDFESVNVRKILYEGIKEARHQKKLMRKKKGEDVEYTYNEIKEYLNSTEFYHDQYGEEISEEELQEYLKNNNSDEE